MKPLQDDSPGGAPQVYSIEGARSGRAVVPPPPETNADLFDYALMRDWAGFVLRAPARHPWISGASFVAVVALAALALWALPRTYQVQARILAQRNQVMWTLSNPGLPRSVDFDAPARAARETVLRRDNLVALCVETKLVQKHLERRAPAVQFRDWLREHLGGRRPTPDERLEAMVDTLETRLWVDVGGEGTVTIMFEWYDRDLAYEVVEAALQNFLEVRHAQEIAMVGETISVLEGHAARLKQLIDDELEKVSELERARTSRAPVRRVAPRPPPAENEEVTRLKSLLTAKRRALADLEEFRRRRLEELQAQLAQQRTIYADRHPILQTTQQSIEALSGPSPQTQSLRNDVSELEREVVRRGGQLETPKDVTPSLVLGDLSPTFAARPDEDPKLEYERGQLRVLVGKYSNLLERIDGARLEMDTAQAAFKYRYTVISPPMLPKRAIRPKPVLLIGAGVLGGLFLAFAAAAALDLRSRRLLERWQVERWLELPVLAELDE